MVSASAEPTGNAAKATPTRSNRRGTHAKTGTGLITPTHRRSEKTDLSRSTSPHPTSHDKPLGNGRVAKPPAAEAPPRLGDAPVARRAGGLFSGHGAGYVDVRARPWTTERRTHGRHRLEVRCH